MSSRLKHIERSHKTMAKNYSDFKKHMIHTSMSKYQQRKAAKKTLGETS